LNQSKLIKSISRPKEPNLSPSTPMRQKEIKDQMRNKRDKTIPVIPHETSSDLHTAHIYQKQYQGTTKDRNKLSHCLI